MKILAIRGTNLASLAGDFEVDFTVAPLNDAGIFAITGTTGAGKSTLLDAMCLALFDDTPRLRKATENKVQLIDVKDEKISQSDPRNLLRRGCALGRAEVDFVSLGGEKYRAVWVARRAHTKADGKLQQTAIELYNLSADTEVPGTKKDLLMTIRELIGLNFEQFTRSVLLAQGDFATFLKAQQSEKAELLEKLTGTGVYSLISAQIFSRTAEAKKALEAVRDRMEGLELLSDEQLQEYGAEQETLEAELKTLNQRSSELDASIKWLEERDRRSSMLEQGKKMLEECKAEHERAEERRKYLSLLDSVQEVRDSYMGLKETVAVIARDKKRQSALNDEITQATENLTKAQDLLKTRREEKAAEATAWAQLANSVKEARAMDVELKSAGKAEAESAAELQKATSALARVTKDLNARQKALNKAIQTLEDCEQWFMDNERFCGVVNDYARIHARLEEYAAELGSRDSYTKSLSGAESLLSRKLTRQQELEAEAERLNHLLPEEISVLRLKLQAGQACPVCGSTEHPYAGLQAEEVLKEKEIEKMRKNLKAEQAQVLKSVTDAQADIAHFKALSEQCAERIEAAMKILTESLTPVVGWQGMLAESTLDAHLAELCQTWKRKEEHRRKAATDKEAGAQSVRLLQEQSQQVSQDLTERKAKNQADQDKLVLLKEARGKLLAGRSADAVEAEHDARWKTIERLEQQAIEQQQRCGDELNRRKGELSELETALKRNATKELEFKASVEQWLQSRKDVSDMEQLAGLMAKDAPWIAGERKALDILNQNLTKAIAMVVERTDAVKVHENSPDKPVGDVTREALSEQCNAVAEEVKGKTAKKTEIAGRLLLHRQNKARISKYEKELAEKTIIYEDWEKLNVLFGSAKGDKFRLMAQGYTLDALLVYANKHLQELTGRYLLQRIPDSLALQVADNDMLGEVRAVHSLSGGESFLISLALALGLASLSSNRMHVESLFIDEGFGSLDADTLRVVMDALERLQTQGRKIGVISHVAEMTERIPVRICVKKGSGGRSKVEVVG